MTDVTRTGHLKIYLGYAPGVGKTYQMLEEARELKNRGVEVVVGYVESQGRDDIRDLLAGLTTIPLARITHRGGTAEELDVTPVEEIGDDVGVHADHGGSVYPPAT